nr:2-oxoglutarate-dependent dioxygenase 11-like [Aegilops tauschii subsp. strangulata]
MEVEAASGSASESRWSKLGTSLPVTNVQALVASAGELTVDKIQRYIQPDIDAHAVLPELSDDVPVIDISKLLSPESAEAETAKLRFACAEWGFFQVRHSRANISRPFDPDDSQVRSDVNGMRHGRDLSCKRISDVLLPARPGKGQIAIFCSYHHSPSCMILAWDERPVHIDLVVCLGRRPPLVGYRLVRWLPKDLQELEHTAPRVARHCVRSQRHLSLTKLVAVRPPQPPEFIMGIEQGIQKFFRLPLEVKNAYAQQPGDLQGYGQAFVVSDDQKLDWADMLALFTQPPQARDMSYWPSQPHTFRMSYYPPCTSTPEKVLGFSPHSDGSFLTILLKVNSVQGLQIRRHGAWVPVKPHSNALLVNVGDLLEIMTNGKYKSIEHRVTINAHKERLSISAFHIPNYDGIISPILGTTGEKMLYKTVKVEEYARLYFSNKLEGKRALDYAKLPKI